MFGVYKMLGKMCAYISSIIKKHQTKIRNKMIKYKPKPKPKPNVLIIRAFVENQ